MGAYTTVANVHEEANTQKEDYDSEGGVTSAEVTLRCAWADRHTVVGDILGNLRLWPHGSGSNPARAQRAGIRPAPGSAFTVVDHANVYDNALVTVHYTTASEQASGTTAAANGLRYSDSIEPIVEYDRLDFRRFRWGTADGDLLTEAEAPVRQLRSMSMVRTIYNMESLPASALTLIGKTNDTAYVSSVLGLTFALETLLWNPPQVTRNVMMDGSASMNVVVKLDYQPGTWNKHWRAKTGSYIAIFDVDAGAVYKNFPPASMSDWLFV